MDVKTYFARIRQVQQTMPGEFVIVSSLETSDGGRSGVLTQVTARSASQLIVEQRARLATEEESAFYRETTDRAALAAVENDLAERIQIKVVSDAAASDKKKQAR